MSRAKAAQAEHTGNEQSAESAAEWVELSRLKPWGKNPRLNDGEPVERVAASIRRFGFGAPIVARLETSEIIAGHTRWKAAKLLRLERVPVRFLDITEDEAHLLCLADNKLGELAEWDDEAVKQILARSSIDTAIAAGYTPEELGKIASSILDVKDALDPIETALDRTFSIVIDCESEAQQRELIEYAKGQGWKCRALI